MTDQRELDRILGSFFVEGTNELPDRVISAALEQIDHTPQRRVLRVPGRFPRMNMSTRIAAAAVFGLFAVGGTLYLAGLPQPPSGLPSPTPTASASPSESVVPAREASWSATGSMTMERYGFSLTLLPDGKVLAAGGDDVAEGVDTAFAEVYDPGTGTWTATGSMSSARSAHTATLLPDGQVLVAGGGQQSEGFAWLASAELYDPGTGTWTATGTMTTPRGGHTATLLHDGTVLVVGGSTDSTDFPGNPEGVTSAELYDPGTGTWTAAASMPTERFGHTATLLPDGWVLVAGGACCGANNEVVATAELYDPVTGTWSAATSMQTQRFGHSAWLLLDGSVLVAGGDHPGTGKPSSAELYEPGAGTWTTTGTMVMPGLSCSSTLLPDGDVLVAGGANTRESDPWYVDPLAFAELYDPGSGTWKVTASMSTPRFCGTSALLLDGRVLVAGGGSADRASAELYDPGSGR